MVFHRGYTSIITSAKNIDRDDASSILEEFWLALSENMSVANSFLQMYEVLYSQNAKVDQATIKNSKKLNRNTIH